MGARFAPADADAPLANPLIAQQIESFAAALLTQLPATASLRARVADATRKLLASGVRGDRARIAHQLGMSDRTLQRRLEDERTTFKEVRDTVLWDAVEALLSNPSLKIEAVALSIGFSELAAFCKAFKRWAGCTPTAYRQRIVRRISRAIDAERTGENSTRAGAGRRALHRGRRTTGSARGR